MKKADQAARARQALDTRFTSFPRAPLFTPPSRGWIKAIRTALGMSYRQLGTRVGIREASVADMERSEEKGSVQLSTLRRVAEGLNCTLVYAFVPKDSLEAAVKSRAREVARRRLKSVDHTMRLEQQQVSKEALEKQLDLFAKEISPRVLWDD